MSQIKKFQEGGSLIVDGVAYNIDDVRNAASRMADDRNNYIGGLVRAIQDGATWEVTSADNHFIGNGVEDWIGSFYNGNTERAQRRLGNQSSLVKDLRSMTGSKTHRLQSAISDFLLKLRKPTKTTTDEGESKDKPKPFKIGEGKSKPKEQWGISDIKKISDDVWEIGDGSNIWGDIIKKGGNYQLNESFRQKYKGFLNDEALKDAFIIGNKLYINPTKNKSLANNQTFVQYKGTMTEDKYSDADGIIKYAWNGVSNPMYNTDMPDYLQSFFTDNTKAFYNQAFTTDGLEDGQYILGYLNKGDERDYTGALPMKYVLMDQYGRAINDNFDITDKSLSAIENWNPYRRVTTDANSPYYNMYQTIYSGTDPQTGSAVNYASMYYDPYSQSYILGVNNAEGAAEGIGSWASGHSAGSHGLALSRELGDVLMRKREDGSTNLQLIMSDPSLRESFFRMLQGKNVFDWRQLFKLVPELAEFEHGSREDEFGGWIKNMGKYVQLPTHKLGGKLFRFQQGGMFGKNVESVTYKSNDFNNEGNRDSSMRAAAIFDNDEIGLTTADKANLASLIMDGAGLVAGLAGGPVGNIFAGTAGAGATTAQLVADIKKDGFDWKDVGYAALGYGLDALSLIPFAGNAAKAAKIGKGIAKVAPALSKVFAAIGATQALGLVNSYISGDKKDFTFDDARIILGALQAGSARYKQVKQNRAKLDLAKEINAGIDTGNWSFDKIKSLSPNLEGKLKSAKTVKEFKDILMNDDAFKRQFPNNGEVAADKFIKELGITEANRNNWFQKIKNYGKKVTTNDSTLPEKNKITDGLDPTSKWWGGSKKYTFADKSTGTVDEFLARQMDNPEVRARLVAKYGGSKDVWKQTAIVDAALRSETGIGDMSVSHAPLFGPKGREVNPNGKWYEGFTFGDRFRINTGDGQARIGHQPMLMIEGPQSSVARNAARSVRNVSDDNVIPLPGPQREVIPLPGPQREVLALPAPQREVLALPAPQREVLALPAPQREVLALPAPQREVLALPAPGPAVISKRFQLGVPQESNGVINLGTSQQAPVLAIGHTPPVTKEMVFGNPVHYALPLWGPKKMVLDGTRIVSPNEASSLFSTDISMLTGADLRDLQNVVKDLKYTKTGKLTKASAAKFNNLKSDLSKRYGIVFQKKGGKIIKAQGGVRIGGLGYQAGMTVGDSSKKKSFINPADIIDLGMTGASSILNDKTFNLKDKALKDALYMNRVEAPSQRQRVNFNSTPYDDAENNLREQYNNSIDSMYTNDGQTKSAGAIGMYEKYIENLNNITSQKSNAQADVDAKNAAIKTEENIANAQASAQQKAQEAETNYNVLNNESQRIQQKANTWNTYMNKVSTDMREKAETLKNLYMTEDLYEYLENEKTKYDQGINAFNTNEYDKYKKDREALTWDDDYVRARIDDSNIQNIFGEAYTTWKENNPNKTMEAFLDYISEDYDGNLIKAIGAINSEAHDSMVDAYEEESEVLDKEEWMKKYYQDEYDERLAAYEAAKRNAHTQIGIRWNPLSGMIRRS